MKKEISYEIEITGDEAEITDDKGNYVETLNLYDIVNEWIDDHKEMLDETVSKDKEKE